MDFNSFFEGFLLGLGAAVPLGPINILIMNLALKSYPKAFFLGFGAMSADITYLLLTLFGLTFFMKIWWVNLIFTIFGAVFLFYLAYLIFKNRKNSIQKQDIKGSEILKNYLKGYLLTLLNPYTVIFWLSISAYINARSLDPIYTLFGLFLAISLWITLMPLAIYKNKHLISQKLAEIFSTISALILSFFAFAMVWSLLFG